MMNWLFPSMVASLAGTIALAVVFTYLAAIEKQPFLAKWATGWWFYALRLCFSLLILVTSPHPLFLIGSHSATLISGVLLLWGTSDFLNRKMPLYWFLCSALILGWIVLASLFSFSFLLFTIPTFIFLGLIYIWTGISFLRAFPRKWFGTALTGYCFVIWGIHKINYPFLRPVEWFAPLGYLLASLLAVFVALGMLLIYFQSTKDELKGSLASLQKSKGELDILMEAMQAVLKEQDFISSAQRIITYCKRLLGVNSGYIFLPHPSDGRERAAYFEVGGPPFSVKPDLLAPLEGLKKKAYETGEVVYDNHLFHGRERGATSSHQEGFTNAMLVPLIIEQQKKGILGLVNKPEDFSDRDARIVEALGELLAIIIRNDQYIQHIRESEEKFSKSFHNNPLMMLITELETGILKEVNRRCIDNSGFQREELIGRSTVDLGLLTREKRGELISLLKEKGFVDDMEMEFGKKNGEKILCRYFGEVIEYGGTPHLLSILQDITEERQAEEERKEIEGRLMQAQKMEAIGTLAGGIAHDFNNILGIIFGYADLVREDASTGTRARAYLGKIRLAAERARDLVSQILTFSRQTEVERRPLRPQLIVKEALKMLRSSIPVTVEFQERIAPDCGVIHADPTQFHQVIMNLMTNAYQAVEENGGVIQVVLQNVETLPEELSTETDAADKYIRLAVKDSGDGIPDAIKEKIFDPFFTTKGMRGGTGMGLATVYGIVKDYEGFITVDSQVGKGSTFEVYLPRIRQEAVNESSEAAALPGGDERILYVDDEKMMVDMGSRLIGKFGYAVTTAENGRQALEIFSSNPDGFDLVVTDQTMPGMTGLELADEILQIRPDMPIILCSGYSNLVDENLVKSRGVKEYALKPLTGKQMAGLVRKVLDAS